MPEESPVKHRSLLLEVYFGSESTYARLQTGTRKEQMMAEIAEAPAEVEEPKPPPMWETAECTCPDWGERDHEQD